MALTYEPPFIQTSALAVVQIATANTALDGSGTLGTLVAGGTNGTLVPIICAKGAEATTANQINIFLSTDNGSTKRHIGSITMAAATPSATVPAASGYFKPYEPIMLADSTDILYVSTNNAEDNNVWIPGAGHY